MPLSTETSAPYAPSKAVLGILERLRRGGLPSTIDKDSLMRLGVSESLAPRTLQSLQVLDLIDETGSHTATMGKLRMAPESEYQKNMEEWLNAAYAEILEYVDPSDGDEIAVRDAFRPYKPYSQQDRMVTLFTGLYGAAGVWPESAQKARVDLGTKSSPRRRVRIKKAALQDEHQVSKKSEKIVDATTGEAKGKALEYQLVDLMSDAAADQDALQAIIKVITFLKTKDAKPEG